MNSFGAFLRYDILHDKVVSILVAFPATLTDDTPVRVGVEIIANDRFATSESCANFFNPPTGILNDSFDTFSNIIMP